MSLQRQQGRRARPARDARARRADDEAGVFTDAAGSVDRRSPRSTTTGVNGDYLTSEGKQGGAAWGTRGKWTTLTGKVDDEPVTIAIFDHPGNPGFPPTGTRAATGCLPPTRSGRRSSATGKEKLGFSMRRGETSCSATAC